MNSKSKIIINAVKQLQDKYGEEYIVVQDYWKDDDNAISIVDKEKKNLVYIAVYVQGVFYLVLEQLTPDEDFPFKEVGEFDNLNFDEVEKKIVEHFNLTK